MLAVATSPSSKVNSCDEVQENTQALNPGTLDLALLYRRAAVDESARQALSAAKHLVFH